MFQVPGFQPSGFQNPAIIAALAASEAPDAAARQAFCTHHLDHLI
jgi:hypothetical protein